MNTDKLGLADKLALGFGCGLIVLAIPVMGLLTTIAGWMSSSYSTGAYYTYKAGGEVQQGLGPAIPDGATVTSMPLFGPNLRGGLVLIGLLVFALFGVYKLVAGRTTSAAETTVATAGD